MVPRPSIVLGSHGCRSMQTPVASIIGPAPPPALEALPRPAAPAASDIDIGPGLAISLESDAPAPTSTSTTPSSSGGQSRHRHPSDLRRASLGHALDFRPVSGICPTGTERGSSPRHGLCTQRMHAKERQPLRAGVELGTNRLAAPAFPALDSRFTCARFRGQGVWDPCYPARPPPQRILAPRPTVEFGDGRERTCRAARRDGLGLPLDLCPTDGGGGDGGVQSLVAPGIEVFPSDFICTMLRRVGCISSHRGESRGRMTNLEVAGAAVMLVGSSGLALATPFRAALRCAASPCWPAAGQSSRALRTVDAVGVLQRPSSVLRPTLDAPREGGRFSFSLPSFICGRPFRARAPHPFFRPLPQAFIEGAPPLRCHDSALLSSLAYPALPDSSLLYSSGTAGCQPRAHSVIRLL
ncbi:uncharacterized protein PSFLO_03615 [Pseudozyma flocculosa]|uniref:Uncharacterized protein n=1 Tax=Pseudozyma flocculosa TaxID=84751 RepID=A0A5C3F140_9BASI|nr:uncharacterized protein PSFLO_03615 [Pseudozyma flocculosa]